MSNQVLGTLHGFCNTKTEDGEIEKVYKNFTEGKLTSYLKKQENYLKISDKKVSDKMNLIELKGTYIGHFIYPINSFPYTRPCSPTPARVPFRHKYVMFLKKIEII